MEAEISKKFKGCDLDPETYQKYEMYTVKYKLSGEDDTGCHQRCLKKHSK